MPDTDGQAPLLCSQSQFVTLLSFCGSSEGVSGPHNGQQNVCCLFTGL